VALMRYHGPMGGLIEVKMVSIERAWRGGYCDMQRSRTSPHHTPTGSGNHCMYLMFTVFSKVDRSTLSDKKCNFSHKTTLNTMGITILKTEVAHFEPIISYSTRGKSIFYRVFSKFFPRGGQFPGGSRLLVG
jgi:hypothetical protein